MRRLSAASALILALGYLTPAQAQQPAAPASPDASAPATSRAVTSTGQTVPSPGGTTSKVNSGGLKPSTEAEMAKAQKAAEQRNKAWDSKMRKTMGSICSGC